MPQLEYQVSDFKIITGVQCVEVWKFTSDLLLSINNNSNQDAVLAVEAGVDGILLSNHGGFVPSVLLKS